MALGTVASALMSGQTSSSASSGYSSASTGDFYVNTKPVAESVGGFDTSKLPIYLGAGILFIGAVVFMAKKR